MPLAAILFDVEERLLLAGNGPVKGNGECSKGTYARADRFIGAAPTSWAGTSDAAHDNVKTAARLARAHAISACSQLSSLSRDLYSAISADS